jgi:hypothetical protein
VLTYKLSRSAIGCQEEGRLTNPDGQEVSAAAPPRERPGDRELQQIGHAETARRADSERHRVDAAQT